MSELINQSSKLLKHMYDPRSGLFSFATRMTDGGFANNFDHPATIRYTVNTLAGLQRAVRDEGIDWDFDAALETFVRQQWTNVTRPSDRGLLLYVLADANHPRTAELFSEVNKLTADVSVLRTFHLQDISWMLMGLCRWAAVSRQADAAKSAERLFRFLDRHFLNKDTMLPYYSLSPWRKAFSAFGGTAYFLRAVSDYALTFNDRYADSIYRESLAQVMALQGPQGEWPWFLIPERANRSCGGLVSGVQRPSRFDVHAVSSSGRRSRDFRGCGSDQEKLPLALWR
jgi:hypothetical protein